MRRLFSFSSLKANLNKRINNAGLTPPPINPLQGLSAAPEDERSGTETSAERLQTH